MAFDVYVSYAEEDSQWIHENLVEELEESSNLSVCLRSRDFDSDLSLIENRKLFVEKCSSCVLVFSKNYCKKASEWSYFTKLIKSKEDKSITGLLDNKGILCIYLSECNVPELFSKQKMLDWTAEDLRDLFWQRLIKFLKTAKKKSDIKKALSGKLKDCSNTNLKSAPKMNLSNTLEDAEVLENLNVKSNEELETEENENQKEEEEEEEQEKTTNVSDYILFDNVYPHLVSSSFCAEDEDLTRDDLEDLTLKMEDVKTMMLLQENNTPPADEQKIGFQQPGITGKNKHFEKFESQKEQMEVLDALQTMMEKFQSRYDLFAVQNQNNNNVMLILRKKRYRRILKNFEDCILQAVNGKKNSALIHSLPFVMDMLEGNQDIHGFQCCCCGNLFHSQRALDIHLDFCVKQHWKDLMKFTPKYKY
uniref:TIR domain-containing protein n=1 Tax=Clytia hemisphaerica TaxID=252671 RepID=A0A7M5VH14_9CNID